MISMRRDTIKKCKERLIERQDTLDTARSEMQKEVDELIYFSDISLE